MINTLLKILGEKEGTQKNSNHPWLSAPRLHTLLPYESYDDVSSLFYNKNSTGFVLKGEPLVGASLQDQGQLAEFFRQKDHLPEGSSLQILLVASPRIGPLLDYWTGARKGEIYQTLAHRRREFMAQKALGEETPQILTYHILISMTIPGWAQTSLEKEALMHIRESLEQALELIGVPVKRLNAEEFLQETANLLNTAKPFYQELVSLNPHEDLSKQIINPDQTFEVTKDGVLMGEENQLCRTYIPKQSPKMWALPHMDRFLGDILSLDSSMPCPFWIHYGLMVEENQGRAKGKVALRRESLENSLKNKLTKWMIGLQEQHEETDSCLHELNKGERIIEACLSMTIMTSPSKLSKVEAKLKHIWNACGWEAVPTTYDHFPMMIASLPMTWTMGRERALHKGQLTPELMGFGKDLARMGRSKKTITREAQNLLPLLAEWKGQNAPGMLLYGRRGQLFMWNPFADALLPGSKAQTDHNYNVCIAGQSGSGKSVFMQELMVSVLGIGGKVFVLDYGRSFKKSCHLLGGEHIEFDLRNPISLNPFHHIPEDNSPESLSLREEMLAALKPILQVMSAPREGTTDLQNAFLERALRDVWENYGQKTTIDHIQHYLMTRDERVAQDLSHMLFPFTSSGVYGRFFMGNAHASLDKDLVVIETDHLRSHPDLMAVLVQMMILEINQTMARGDRQKPFLIMIDEAWKLLTGKDSGAFIAEITRTARKYKGGLVLGTQHLKDYFKESSPAAREAFDCSAWKCLLYQEADALKALKEHPQLKTFIGNDAQEALLCSLRARPPYYSEVALFGPDLRGVVGRLSLDPFSRLLYSTNAQEYQRVEEELKRGKTLTNAIETLLKEDASCKKVS